MTSRSPLTAIAALVFLLATPTTRADGMVTPVPGTSPALTSDSVNLSGKDFFRAYANPDRQVSERARLYMLGVSDAGEGRVWCGYKRFSTATLQEFVYEYFRKLPEGRLNERASTLIQEALKSNFPCTPTK